MPGPPIILLVDDNAELLTLLKEELAGPHRIRMATDGDDAWTQIQDDPPDLLVCDAEISGPSQALCLHVKETPDVPSMPIVLLGTPSDDAPGVDALGVDAVVTKPFSVSDLRQRIDRYLPSLAISEFSGAGSVFLKRVVRVVERRLHNPDFAVEALAEAMDLSRRHLTRRLQAAAETTPAALIRSRRIERAKVLLAKRPETIREVGKAVGFRSASHFSSRFREEVGLSPSEYVKQHAA